MAVYEGVPTVTTYLGMVLNNAIQKRRSKERMSAVEGNRVQSRWLYSLTRIVLHIVGFSALTKAAFEWNMIAGWSAVAVSCFAFSWLFTGASETASADNGQMRR